MPSPEAKAKRDTEWGAVRVPKDLQAEIELLRAEIEEAYMLGLMELPDDYSERVPLHYVVRRAVREYRDHRFRARRRRS